MNRTMYIFLTALVTCAAAHAVDIKTDASCKKLVAAISQAQPLESCKTAWQKVSESTTIVAQDRTQILQQTLQLAHEQKAALEQELTNLGTQTKNYSKIKWGSAQLALGSYLAASLTLSISAVYKKYKTGNHTETNNILGILVPFAFFQQKFPGLGVIWTIGLAVHVLLLNPIGTVYLLPKGYYNLKHGLNYQQFLQDKIANLDAIISYLQELQPQKAA